MVIVHLWPPFVEVYRLVMNDNVPGVLKELSNSLNDERAWAALYLAAFNGSMGTLCSNDA